MTTLRRAGAGVALALLAAVPALAGVRPRPGGEVRILLAAPPGELDPARAASPSDLLLARALHATLLELGPEGRLRPGLAGLPEVSPDGLELRFSLRPNLRFHGGAPLTAGDAAESLARLLRPETGSPHSALAGAIEGAAAVREGRARALSGAVALSERELLVRLAFPFPGFARGLAAAPAAVLRSVPGAPPEGAGPFQLAARGADSIRLRPFGGHHRGRPWADAIAISWPDAAQAGRRLARGEAEAVLRPDLASAALEASPSLLVVAAVNGRRLGPAASAVRSAIASLDRAELARLVRGAAVLRSLLPPTPIAPGTTPAGPLGGGQAPALRPQGTPTSTATPTPPAGPLGGGQAPALRPQGTPTSTATPTLPSVRPERSEAPELVEGAERSRRATTTPPSTPTPALSVARPPALSKGSSEVEGPTPVHPPTRIVLLAPASLKPLADRLQVKLFDRGLRTAVEAVGDAQLPARLAAGGYDAALLAVPLASDVPALGLAQVGAILGGPPAAARILGQAAVAEGPDLAALAERLEEDLRVVPLAALHPRAAARAPLQGLSFLPDGTLDPGDLWLLPERRGP